MMEKLEAVFEALKQLDMKPTPGNVSIMDGVYRLLREMYEEVDGGKPDGREDRTEADSE